MQIRLIAATVVAVASGLALSPRAFADSFHWSGDVNSGAKISIHDNKVHIDTPDSGSTKNEHSEFHGKLKKGTYHVRLVSYSGRGRVRIHQQPEASNDYTAVVSINEKNYPGAGHYEFTLVWR